MSLLLLLAPPGEAPPDSGPGPSPGEEPAAAAATAGERLYAELAPLHPLDASYGEPLRRFCLAAARALDLVDEVSLDRADLPGWAVMLHPDLAPEWALDWLAVATGSPVVAGGTAAEKRAAIRDRPYRRRGTPATIVAAAKTQLTGGQNVLLQERYGGAAYQLRITTLTAETPNVAALTAAVQDEKPAGLVLTVVVASFNTYAYLTGAFVDYAALATAFTTYADMEA